MARRRINDDPTSRFAIWSRRCALFSLIAAILAVVIVRSGFLEIEPALATLAGALLFSVFAIVLALGAFIVIWREGAAGASYAFTGLAIGAALIAYPAYLGVRGYALPMINDITTDTSDPPRFEVLAQIRPRDMVEYPGRSAAEQQRAAYPDVEPLSLTATPQIAYEEAIKLITKRKWRIMVERPPQAGRREGRIEAIARTPVMGFRDDVVLRIRAEREGARIDMRSASRFGQHDLGANAARIKSLLEDIDDAVGSRIERPAPRPTPAKPQPAKR